MLVSWLTNAAYTRLASADYTRFLPMRLTPLLNLAHSAPKSSSTAWKKNKTAAHPSGTVLHGTCQDGVKSNGPMTNHALFIVMQKRESCAFKKLDGVIVLQLAFYNIIQGITLFIPPPS